MSIRLTSEQCERVREALRRYDSQRGQGQHLPVEDLAEEILGVVLPQIEFTTQVREERPDSLAELIGGGVQGAGAILSRDDAQEAPGVVDGPEAHKASRGRER